MIKAKIKSFNVLSPDVLSPDGFPIERDKTYKSIEEAEEALNRFVDRYKLQGYYSTIMDGERVKIPLSEIKQYCQIQTN